MYLKASSSGKKPADPRLLSALCQGLLIGVLASSIGCNKSNPVDTALPPAAQAGSGATITADPNPCFAEPKKAGTTTITWNTGDGKVGEVYVSFDGSPEKAFAKHRSQGSLEAPWIGKGVYEFRLYAGTDHSSLLASVKVTKQDKLAEPAEK